jgi:RimJ/RimL family protein N-acetyltransferase
MFGGVIEVRPWAPDDAPALNRAVAESREHVSPWMAWAAEPPMSDAARRAWIAEREREARGGGDRAFGVFLDGAIAGGCGLHRRIGPGGLEIGYWTHVAHVRRGVARTAVARLCAIAFAEPSITRVEIHHDVANPASGAVAAASGFTVVGDRPAEGPVAAAPAASGSERVWRLTRGAWAARVDPDPPMPG